MEDPKSSASATTATDGATAATVATAASGGGGDASHPTFDFVVVGGGGGDSDTPSDDSDSGPGTTFDAGGTSFAVGSSSRACAGELRRRRIVRVRRPAAGVGAGSIPATGRPGTTRGGTAFAAGMTTAAGMGMGTGMGCATTPSRVSPGAIVTPDGASTAERGDEAAAAAAEAPGGGGDSDGDRDDHDGGDDSDGAARAGNRFYVLQNSDTEEDEDSDGDDDDDDDCHDDEKEEDDDDHSSEEDDSVYASGDEDEDASGCGGGGRRHCAICFGSSPSSLVVLPCCGSNGREAASSTRFCSGCIVRLARKNGTPGRVGGGAGSDDGSDDDDDDGDDDDDDGDGDGDSYLDAVVSCSNEHTIQDVIGEGRSMHVTECPRCRDLLAVFTAMGHPFHGSSPPSWMCLEERGGCASHVQREEGENGRGRRRRKKPRTVALGRPPFELAARYARRKESLRPALRLVARVYPHCVPLELFMTLKAEGPTRVHRARDDADTLAKWGILTKRPNRTDTYSIDADKQRLLREQDDRERAVRSFANFMMNRFLHHGADDGDDDDEDEDGPDGGINETLTRVAHQCFEAGGLALGRGRLVAALRLFNQTETLALRVSGLLRLEDEDDDDDDADGDGGGPRHGRPSLRGMAMGMAGGGGGHRGSGRPTTASSTSFRYHWQGWMVASLNVFLLAWIVQGLCVAALYAAAGYAVVRLVGWAVRGGEGGGGRDGGGGVRGGGGGASGVVVGRRWRHLLPHRVPVWVRGPLVMVMLALLRGRMRQLLVILPHVLHALRPWR